MSWTVFWGAAMGRIDGDSDSLIRHISIGEKRWKEKELAADFYSEYAHAKQPAK